MLHCISTSRVSKVFAVCADYMVQIQDLHVWSNGRNCEDVSRDAVPPHDMKVGIKFHILISNELRWNSYLQGQSQLQVMGCLDLARTEEIVLLIGIPT